MNRAGSIRIRTQGARRALILALVLSAPALAQPKPLVESLEVRVTSIEVIVTDEAGNPIRGLDRSRFTVYENDIAQPITNFSEIDSSVRRDEQAVDRPEALTAVPARRFVHVFIDEYSLNPIQRTKTFDALEAMLASTLTEGDEIAITRWIQRPEVVLPFTRDLTKVPETLWRIRDDSVMGLSFLSQRRMVSRNIEQLALQARSNIQLNYDAAIAEAGDYRDQLLRNLRNLAADLAVTMSTMGSLEGRRVLILVGDSLPLNPGFEMYEVATRAFRPRLDDGSIERAKAEAGAYQESGAFPLELIARAANANGVTLYALSPGLRVTADDGAIFSSDLSLGTVPFVTFTNSADSFEQVAEATGGAATTDPRTLDRILGTLASDLRSYYSIGYRPTTEGTRARSIRVEVDVPGTMVRTRDTMVIKTSEEDVAARALTCLLQQVCESDFSFRVVLGEPTKLKRNRYTVPLEVFVPMQFLTPVPTDTGSLAGFSVHLAALTETGELSEGTVRHQRVSVSAEDAGTALQRELRWGIELEAKKGTTKVLVAVTDEVSMLTGMVKAELVVRKK